MPRPEHQEGPAPESECYFEAVLRDSCERERARPGIGCDIRSVWERSELERAELSLPSFPISSGLMRLRTLGHWGGETHRAVIWRNFSVISIHP